MSDSPTDPNTPTPPRGRARVDPDHRETLRQLAEHIRDPEDKAKVLAAIDDVVIIQVQQRGRVRLADGSLLDVADKAAVQAAVDRGLATEHPLGVIVDPVIEALRDDGPACTCDQSGLFRVGAEFPHAVDCPRSTSSLFAEAREIRVHDPAPIKVFDAKAITLGEPVGGDYSFASRPLKLDVTMQLTPESVDNLRKLERDAIESRPANLRILAEGMADNDEAPGAGWGSDLLMAAADEIESLRRQVATLAESDPYPYKTQQVQRPTKPLDKPAVMAEAQGADILNVLARLQDLYLAIEEKWEQAGDPTEKYRAATVQLAIRAIRALRLPKASADCSGILEPPPDCITDLPTLDELSAALLEAFDDITGVKYRAAVICAIAEIRIRRQPVEPLNNPTSTSQPLKSVTHLESRIVAGAPVCGGVEEFKQGDGMTRETTIADCAKCLHVEKQLGERAEGEPPEPEKKERCRKCRGRGEVRWFSFGQRYTRPCSCVTSEVGNAD